ncbi:hypothetical protein RT723_02070 [Psychrosphaera aquimarina]|uniref:Uncharacterized protein n=1 Tax=Psychrosphaera aquimarina TaxID=2044854 RepID=A0ABU3QWL1_9GAMM|nr:hypothetical protein [Psychrosphaera aquimarina]MDU0111814.1 hypothetical protein [Psychrosphaera aquimarina]
MASAHRVLDKSLEYTKKQGKIANTRGFFFEKQIQDVIDKTKYKPSKLAYKYISKTLKLNNKAITDFDAILQVGTTLVAISCKSILQTDIYDKGDFKSIRNVTSSIEGYMDDWKTKIKLVNENKKGDNYDFSSFDDILGIVLTPTIFYIGTSFYAELDIKGLYTHMSQAELIKWLEESSNEIIEK